MLFFKKVFRFEEKISWDDKLSFPSTQNQLKDILNFPYKNIYIIYHFIKPQGLTRHVG